MSKGGCLSNLPAHPTQLFVSACAVMIGDLFRKRDSVYSNGVHVPGVGLLSSALQFSSLASEDNNNKSNNENGSQGSGDHFSTFQDSTYMSSSSFAANGITANSFQRMAIQEADKLSDQSNLHMPSLYGLNSNSHAPNPSVKVSEKLNCFRMVVIQDAGIRNKQPLFDSAVPNNKNFPAMQHKLNKKIHHSINELSLFMFGCYGMPISENNITTKLHYLPALANLSASVLVTRLFSLDTSFKLKPHRFSQSCSEWDPHPILQTDELPLNENSSIRFAIGLIIPVSSSVESVRDEITEIWFQLSEKIRSLQDTITLMLKYQYSASLKMKKQQHQQQQQPHQQHQHTYHNSPGQQLNPSPINAAFQSNSNAKLNFPLYCLQSEVEIYQELSFLLSHLVSLVEIPRLFIDLKHSNQSLINWATTLSLWLELKDGKIHHSDQHINDPYQSSINQTSHPIKFLASLLYILLPLLDELFDSGKNMSDFQSRLRVVISTSNPIVSQKLIFIIAGILGYEKFSKIYNKYQQVKDSYQSKVPLEMKTSKPVSFIHENESSKRNVLTRNNSLIIDIPLNNADIQAKTNGFNIPSPSISTISANVQSQRIPVPSLTRTSSYASLQNLSSSYNANYNGSLGSSQTPSSSWRNNIGSFMDRWKTSMSPSSATSQFSQPHSHSSQYDTPSPNLEYDEYPWYMVKKPGNTTSSHISSSPAPSFMSLRTSSTQQPNRFTLTNNPLIGTYKAKESFEVNRSTNNVIGIKTNSMKESVAHEISSIMDGNFDYFLSDLDESVIDVDPKGVDISDITNPQIPLPLLVGYISQYRPEFNMMSCPNKNLKDDLFIRSMKADLEHENISESRFYFINLATKNVDFLEMKDDKQKKRDELTSKTHTGESDGILFKSKNQPKSNLTKNLSSNYELKQSTILTPTKQLHNENTPGIIQSGNISVEEHVYAIDQILEKIACTINNFFYEISVNSDAATSEYESECCDSIRQLILELLNISKTL